MFVDVRIDDPPTTSEGCVEGWGYYVDDSSHICEPLDKIGKSPPSDMAFCAALGCPYNPLLNQNYWAKIIIIILPRLQ